MVDPVSPRREQLARIVGNDNRLLLSLERLFQVAGQITPDQIAQATATIEGNAAAIAENLALINAIAGTQAVSTTDSPFAPTGSGTILCDATAGPIVISLDPAVTNAIINVKKIDAGENAVTLTPTSGAVDGSPSAPITMPFAAITVISNGTDWFIL